MHRHTSSGHTYWRNGSSCTSPTTLLRYTCIALITLTATNLTCAFAAPPDKSPEQPVEKELDALVAEINDKARILDKSKDSEILEQLRRERWNEISARGDVGDRTPSRWLKAYAAIYATDGPVHVDSTKDSMGLLNKLEYKEACATLRSAWNEMIREPDAPVLGELAVRLFEVAQQAKSCYRDALEPGSSNQVATPEELLKALREADARDPCCIMARALMLYLAESDSREAFLRAEVRADFRTRQQALVALSHRLISTTPNRPAEHADETVLPWHATAELNKARSLEQLLRDLDFTKPLTPDFQLPSYIVPGEIFAGTDSLQQPFQFFQGRTLIGKAIDENGFLRTAIMFLDRSGRWDYRYLDLLWRNPDEDELSNSLSLQTKSSLVRSHAYRSSWKLGNETYCLYDFPTRDTRVLIQAAAQVFCVKRATDFEKLRFSANANKANVISRMEAPWLAQSAVRTTPQVTAELARITAVNDVTKHTLTELMSQESLNPLIIVSNRDKSDVRPNFFRDDQGQPPYLLLDDGTKLHFSLEGAEHSPCCYIDYGGVKAYMPMSNGAVPRAVLLGTPIGKAFVGLLQDAGYSEEESLSYIRNVMNDPLQPAPDKFTAMLRARVMSQRKTGEAIFAEMLEEKGWQGTTNLGIALNQIYSQYGFRYLRDPRGNWIMMRSLSESLGPGKNGDLGLARKDTTLSDYPYEYLAPDGKQRIATTQIYSWKDYGSLYDNISREHLGRVILFHPCLPALSLLSRNASLKPVHPEENRPDYLMGLTASNSPAAGAGKLTDFAGTKPANELLTNVFPKWMANDDSASQKTLTNLHVAYYNMIFRPGELKIAITSKSLVLARLRRAISYLSNPKDVKILVERAASLASEIAADSKTRDDSMEALLTVQLESARDYARRKYFHRAIVFYNDFLEELADSEDIDPAMDVFVNVPSTERMQSYIDDLDRAIDKQRLRLDVQIELAGVLNASGLLPSALYVWQRSVDDYDHFLAPSLKIAEDMLESYGLRLSKRAHEEVADISASIEIAINAINKYDLAVGWRDTQESNADADKEAAVSRRIAQVFRMLDRDTDRDLTGEEESSLETELLSLPKDPDLNFGHWLQLKKRLLGRPALVFRTNSVVPPWYACPLTYDSKAGFGSATHAVAALLNTTQAEQVREWCAKPADDANLDPLAAPASFLLGWYWLDKGRLSEGRHAFVNLAHVQFGAATADERSTSGLVHEFSAYTALISACAIVESLPGLSSYKTDYSGFLLAQLTDWEKRWFALGNYGPHASEQRFELQARAKEARAALWRSRAAWRNDRYFFPDYTFEFGAVPDFIVAEVMKSPQLFTAPTPAALEEKGKQALEDRRIPANVSVALAEAYLRTLKVNGALDKELVHLGD